MKGGLIIHVHGVASPEEAERLESLGVDLIGVAVGERATGRIVDRNAAYAIAERLQRARLCVELHGTASLLEPQTARRMGVHVAQIPWGTEVPQTWRQALIRAGVEWALVRVPADEDDDPSWVRARMEEAGTPPPAWTQVEICPSLEDSWRVLRDASENDLDAHDLDVLAAKSPILFSLPLRLDDLKEIQRGLLHARGFSFALGDTLGEAPGAHHFTPNQVSEILRRLEVESN